MDNQQGNFLDEEIWKQCSIIDKFEVSNKGRVRHVKDKSIKYTKKDKLGYVMLQYSENGKYKNYKVHRLIALTFIPNTDNKPEVNHIDGDKTNNHVSNLEWVTRRENILHGHAIGLYDLKGINNGRSILTEDIVHALCKWYEDDINNTPKLAVVKFNISIQQASKIRCGIAWKHISCLYNIIPIKVRRKTFND